MKISDKLKSILEDKNINEWSGGRAYPRDPFWLKAKYPGVDKNGKHFKKGDDVFYYPNSRTFLTGEEAKQASRDFDAAKQDEVFYNQ